MKYNIIHLIQYWHICARVKLFRFECWFAVKKIHLSCVLWNLRGLQRCGEHGFCTQSWITGKCKKCEDKKNDNT